MVRARADAELPNAAAAEAAAERRRAAARARYAKRKEKEKEEGAADGGARRRKAKKHERDAAPHPLPATAFRPAAMTSIRAPDDVCFEAMLNNAAAAACLRSWRWMFVLPQVCRAWRAAFNPNAWMRWACEEDPMPMIWKAKAMQLFGLARHEIDALPFRRRVYGCWRNKEVHLLERRRVLQLAMAKHGGGAATLAAALHSRDGKGR